MKTKCYCVYCKKHPLFIEKKDFKVVTGFQVGNYVSDMFTSGRDVNCLNPISDAFDDFDIDPENYEFPITAYGDGISQTGFEGRGYIIYANCDNEEYED